MLWISIASELVARPFIVPSQWTEPWNVRTMQSEMATETQPGRMAFPQLANLSAITKDVLRVHYHRPHGIYSQLSSEYLTDSSIIYSTHLIFYKLLYRLPNHGLLQAH